MKQDKYSGYWKIKGRNVYYKVFGQTFPRWRRVTLYKEIINHNFEKISATETVDFLRLHCEKITEKEFKYETRG